MAQIAVDQHRDKAYGVRRDLDIGGNRDMPHCIDVCDSY